MFDMRDLLARFRELNSMNFLSYFRPTMARQTKSYLIMKRVIDGHRYAFVYSDKTKSFYFDEKLVMSCPIESRELAA